MEREERQRERERETKIIVLGNGLVFHNSGNVNFHISSYIIVLSYLMTRCGHFKVLAIFPFAM